MKNTIRLIAALAALAGFSDAALARNCAGLGDAYYNDPSGKCYYAESTAVDQTVAQAACIANGGYLAAIGSAAEQTILASTFNGMGELFVGGSDVDTEDTWVWGGGDQQGQTFWQGLATGGSPRGLYTNWESTQPNNNSNADCLSFNTGAGGQWYDVACTAGSMSGYLCELYACRNPLGDQGEVIFNQDSRTLQYCNGVSWVAMAQAAYQQSAVVFDGTNDYMTSASVQAADTQMVTGSVWIKYNTAVNQPYTIVGQNGAGDFRVRYTGGSNNRFEVYGRNSGGTIVYQVQCGGLPVVGQWYHVVFSVDLSDVNKRHCYVNDVLAQNYVVYTTGETINADLAGVRIGANNDGPASNKLNASVADLWLDFGTYIDLSVAGNRRKFIDASGRAVNLGSNGALPTGAAPEIFLSGSLGAWNNNKGTATGYTLTGALTADLPPGTFSGLGVVSSGLVGYWPLNDVSGTTAVEETGGFNGTYQNGPVSTAGQIGAARDFTIASSQRVNIPHNARFDLSTYSLSAWVKSDSPSDGSNPGFAEKIIDKNTNYSLNWDHNGFVGSACEHYNGVWHNTANPAPPLLAAGTWYHMVCTYDGSNLIFYIDGAVAGSRAGVPAPNPSGSAIGIGYLPNSSDAYFDGVIDDVRIYNRALTPTEVTTLYNWGLAGGSLCTNPSRSPGTIIYNDVSNVPQFCDGGVWRPLGVVPGPGGAGCSNPSRGEGYILFNSASRTMQYCDGVTWRAMPGMGIGAPTAGLVNHWPMEDGAAAMTIDDIVGTNDCAVQINGGTRTNVTGKVGNALQYQNSFARCGVIAALHDTTKVTISAWMKRTNPGDNVYVFEEGGGNSLMGIDFYSNGETYFTFTNPPQTGFEEGSYTLNDTQWHLVTLVYDGSLTGNTERLKGYINGQQVTINPTGTIDASTSTFAGAPQFRLFNWDGTGNGSIDDVRIYNRALTAEEVAQLYFATGGQ